MAGTRKIVFLGHELLDPSDANRLWYPVVPSDDGASWFRDVWKMFFPTWEDALDYARWINSGCPEMLAAQNQALWALLWGGRREKAAIRLANQKYRILVPRPLTAEEAGERWFIVGPDGARPGSAETALFRSSEKAFEYVAWKDLSAPPSPPGSRSGKAGMEGASQES